MSDTVETEDRERWAGLTLEELERVSLWVSRWNLSEVDLGLAASLERELTHRRALVAENERREAVVERVARWAYDESHSRTILDASWDDLLELSRKNWRKRTRELIYGGES